VETFPGKMFMRPHLKWHTPLIGKNKYKDWNLDQLGHKHETLLKK
jgi:hypothetical protein